MALFGITASNGSSAEFYAVSAKDKDEAEMLVSQELSHDDSIKLEVSDLEALLGEQYEGLALLWTT